jgi:hypothetical protein
VVVGLSLSVISFCGTASASTAKLKPNANLAADTRFTAMLTAAINDVNGHPMVQVTWTFLTGPRPTAVPTTPLAGRPT